VGHGAEKDSHRRLGGANSKDRKPFPFPATELSSSLHIPGFLSEAYPSTFDSSADQSSEALHTFTQNLPRILLETGSDPVSHLGPPQSSSLEPHSGPLEPRVLARYFCFRLAAQSHSPVASLDAAAARSCSCTRVCDSTHLRIHPRPCLLECLTQRPTFCRNHIVLAIRIPVPGFVA
jgi:hypothetical protein